MTVAEILSHSEPTVYGDELVSLEMDGKEVFVISDLHIAAGLNANGNYDGTENFFADFSFFRFLTHLRTRISAGKHGLLVINGDFVDFLRIRNVPLLPDDLQKWSAMLLEIGIAYPPSVLRASVVKKEVQYGLKTNDYKSVWKLDVCYQGHLCVFESLAGWVAEGNELLIIKGNHDLEWFWKPVRDYLRLLLAKNIASTRKMELATALQQIVIPNTRFADDKLVIGREIYIEHGHRYENFTTVDGDAVIGNKTELNLPFGSFFNRYLINRIELAYPYMNDVRPRKKILPLLIRERFPLALIMLFRYIPFTLLIIPKKQYAYALRYLLQVIWIIAIPVIVTGYIIYSSISHAQASVIQPATKTSYFLQIVLPQLKNLLFLSLSYFLGRLFSIFSLSAPTTLFPDAQVIFDAYAEVRYVTFGHTHDPEQKRADGKTYYNTGTWVPVYEMEAANVRLDKTYTFLWFSQNESKIIHTDGLMRWNDEAGRTESMALRDSV